MVIKGEIGLNHQDQNQIAEMPKLYKLNRKIVLALRGCVFVACTSQSIAAAKPQLQCDAIYFSDNKILHVEGATSEHCISQDDFRIIESWERVIVIRRKSLPEDSVTYVDVYNYSGTLLNKSEGFMGKVLVLDSVNKIFLGSVSVHFTAKESYLLDNNGRRIKNISQPKNVFEIKKSDDDKLVWLLSQSMHDGKPYIQLTLLNKDADVIETKNFYNAETYTKNYDGKEYKILIPEPLVPG